MRKRLLIGPVLIVALVAAFWLDELIDAWVLPDFLHPLLGGRDTPPPGTLLFLIAIPLIVLAARELTAMLRANGIAASNRVGSIAALLGLCVTAFIPATLEAGTAAAAISTTAVVVLLASLTFYSRHRSFEGALSLAGAALLSFVYLGLLAGFFIAIRRDHSAWLVLAVLVTTKSCDIGAYFTGTAIGKHKLIIWLSPGKTWEGLAGGVVAAMIVGALSGWILGFPEPGPRALWLGAIAGILFALVGQLGDLLESLFKRDAQLKDAGQSIPGFGGVLDLLDSPLLVAPVAYWWITLLS
ncbi:MAG: phosphatidate cytidylyltransferase [Phycisphaerales bacterium JB037]